MAYSTGVGTNTCTSMAAAGARHSARETILNLDKEHIMETCRICKTEKPDAILTDIVHLQVIMCSACCKIIIDTLKTTEPEDSDPGTYECAPKEF